MSQTNNIDGVVILQGASAIGTFVTLAQPIVSLIFMVVSIISGCILIYKFFAKKQ